MRLHSIEGWGEGFLKIFTNPPSPAPSSPSLLPEGEGGEPSALARVPVHLGRGEHTNSRSCVLRTGTTDAIQSKLGLLSNSPSPLGARDGVRGNVVVLFITQLHR